MSRHASAGIRERRVHKPEVLIGWQINTSGLKTPEPLLSSIVPERAAWFSARDGRRAAGQSVTADWLVLDGREPIATRFQAVRVDCDGGVQSWPPSVKESVAEAPGTAGP
jgi:hypothetical protein